MTFWLEFAYSRPRMRNLKVKSTSCLETTHIFKFRVIGLFVQLSKA